MRLPLAPTAGMSAEKLWKQKKKSKRKRSNNKDGSKEEEDTGYDGDALAIANEIEGERTHRRIATRGVVALFNAISKHRAAVAAEAAAKEEEKRRVREEGRGFGKKKNEEDGASTKTKHGFLEMIKKSAVAGESASKGNDAHGGSKEHDAIGANGGNKDSATTTKGAGKSSVGWSALKDDFMMNSKLKDWDKEISDDEDDEPSGGGGVPATATTSEKRSSRKRQKA